ncbi:hypothetical protein R1flu_006962 [Riccia fluitans]|uniref:Uncharacterized protein n=1 Tax=Riccia fluitans TaxID=41844 RepID=A0ABD1YYA1_9MARC
MPTACITASKFLRWWSGLVTPSPLNLLTYRAALTAWVKSCLGTGKEFSPKPLPPLPPPPPPPIVGNGVGTVGKVIAGKPLTEVTGAISGEPMTGTPVPDTHGARDDNLVGLPPQSWFAVAQRGLHLVDSLSEETLLPVASLSESTVGCVPVA